MVALPDIPLQAKELLDFNALSAACLASLFLLGFGCVLLAEKFFKLRRKGLFRTFFLSVYCLLCALTIHFYGIRKEQQNRLQWAGKIAFSRHLQAEEKLAARWQQLQQNGVLPQAFTQIESLQDKEALLARWQRDIIDSAFAHYRCFFTLCAPDETLLLENNQSENCKEFFDKKAQSGITTEVPGLYGIDYGIEYYAYLYQVPVRMSADTLLLNMELGRKKFADVPGSPGLQLPSAYSYAFYADDELWSYSGRFIYTFNLKNETPDELCFIDRKGYSHLFYPLPRHRLLVLSTPKPQAIDILHNFSLFFLLFGMGAVLILLLFDKNFLGAAGTYARQVRIGTFSLFLFVMVVFGAVSMFFIRRVNQNENTKILQNQSLPILAEMERKNALLPDDWLQSDLNDSVRIQLHNQLEELCNLFRKDIYLYSTQGRLLSSPRQESLLPQRLDEKILERIAEDESHLLILQDSLSLLAVASFRNAYGEVIGFLCIPYYLQADRQRAEMSRFLCTYLNIMLLLGLLCLGFSSLLARRITKPLQLVTHMVAQIKPAQKNEALVWKGNDEIGLLVRQYNLLVEELDISLRKLAESERESAWNEMARQVAHEIKNPLTPIKLQVQLLQRAYAQSEPAAFKERLDKFADLLSEQIDRLSHIAGTFSQFAQWQKPQLQEVQPAQVIRKTLDLFKADENVRFIADIDEAAQMASLRADRGFLEQILVNLLRNAVQAMEEAHTPDPVVRVGLRFSQTQSGAGCCLFVEDNGPGIPAEKLKRIFEPHFTTRSTGTGLGLAICRRLAENMSAGIEVESHPDTGTRFTLKFSC